MIDPAAPDFANTPAAATRPAFAYVPQDTSAAPFATIVTPFFDTGPVFRETARSVLRQSLQQWEWVIVNDGSTDRESLTMLEEFRHRDPRIRVIDHRRNRGLSAARNTGFLASRAPYVVQLDSDDLLEPTAVEKWCWYLESHPDRAFAKGYTVQFGASTCLWTRGFHEGRAFLTQNLVNPTGAVRRSVHQTVQGYDESDRGGLMDWDFWLRCAAAGYWGGTVPEYLDWYRRRVAHQDRWPDFDEGPRQRAYLRRLREKYRPLWRGAFPQLGMADFLPGPISHDLPCENLLRRSKRRMLVITAWMCLGGADRFNLELIEELSQRGWEITIATTLAGDHSWLPQYARHTPDIFCLHHFLAPRDYPRFLRYLIASRQTQTVLVTHSELGYQLLPYLRLHAPDVTYVDYCHIEEEAWKNGGYPRMSIDCQEMLDLHAVSSRHLANWMAARGADSRRIRVRHINVDTRKWRPDPRDRASTRCELQLGDSVGLILFAGRLHPQKKPRVLARTLQRLHREQVPFLALLAGDGPDRGWLASYIARHRLGRQVRLLGEIPSPRLQQLMRAADVFFLPSQWEGIAATLFEAMSSETPPVASDVGGQSELVTPDCGVLVAPAPPDEELSRFAAEITRLLRDPQRRANMGAAARQRVERYFDRSSLGAGMLDLLEEAENLRRAKPRPQRPEAEVMQCAEQAVESIRFAQWSAQLWAARNQPGLRRSTYRIVSRLATPAYLLAGRLGWNWFFVLGDRVKKALFFSQTDGPLTLVDSDQVDRS